ncbi:hypothetical protein QFZ75_007265 [Streptomyces sp. V3I8]|uniref:hypothetical protein n=1 Tax=Streptomyces sp. V3I8 TaxID=3042279 RepID=UPI00278376A7|nr:hypothetical protein [Streptomyces sp. V3I8]MDQ1040849.1 hypothetical protein [Streptomyces sp. V3I8]
MIRRAAVAALAGTALMLPFAGTSSAAAQGKELNCRTQVTDNGHYGRADCRNDTSRAIAFRAIVVCGQSFDNTGAWVTLNPGQSGWSGAPCNAPVGTGVGSVDWEEG